DLNAQEVIRTTPLHVASAKGNLNIVELLIKHAADLDQPDQNEETSLHLASHHGHLQTASLLLESGSN
ncbi:ankyrin repeat-containing domain protein, partial [Russula compacta]